MDHGSRDGGHVLRGCPIAATVDVAATGSPGVIVQ
jgi:hypothetical protein